MTSRERVKRCINFENPDRCPMSLPAPYPHDFCGAGISADPDWKPWREGLAYCRVQVTPEADR